MTIDINTLNSEDIIDVRDIIERYEELEDEPQDLSEDGAEEFQQLSDILDSLKGYGGDEQWRGDWYPVTLIRESYFTDYTEELISDCYSLNVPDFVHIDWEATAREVLVDYSQTEINGVTYFYR